MILLGCEGQSWHRRLHGWWSTVLLYLAVQCSSFTSSEHVGLLSLYDVHVIDISLNIESVTLIRNKGKIAEVIHRGYYYLVGLSCKSDYLTDRR